MLNYNPCGPLETSSVVKYVDHPHWAKHLLEIIIFDTLIVRVIGATIRGIYHLNEARSVFR